MKRLLWNAVASGVASLAVPTAFAAVPAVALNDTGITYCRDGAGIDSPACSGTGEDGEFGRDVTVPDATDGKAGFSFIKICNNGKMAGVSGCAVGATLGSAATDWACTRDKQTAYVWELKTTDAGLRDAALRYTNWGDGRAGDVSAYVAAVNAQGLCGSKNWRLPSVFELQGLVDYGTAVPGPTIARDWFPNTVNTLYWTSDGYAADPSAAWGIGFLGGYVGYHSRSVKAAAILVRGTVGL